MKSLIVTLINLCLIGATCVGQENQIIDIGKPFNLANVYQLPNCVVPSSLYINDFTTILVDRGQLNPSNNVLPLNCFKIIFVDLLAKQSQVVEVKDKNGTIITAPIGDPFTWIYGADGNIYLATQGGGHLVCIDYKNRKAIDLGKPIEFEGIPNLTTIALGVDLSLYGIINNIIGCTQGAYSFKYDYNFTFSQKDTTVIDAERPRAKAIGADEKYKYVRCENADFALYAINKMTKEKKRIVLYYNNAPLDTAIPFEIECYAGDYVYARISTDSGSYYWKLSNGEVLDNQSPDLLIRRRVDYLWQYIFTNNTNNISVIWNNVTNRLYYQTATTNDYVDLSTALQKFYRPTGSMTLYTNANTSGKELFIHGQKYSYAASLKYNNNNQFNILGANSNQSTYSVISDFDNTKVLIGSYANGTIQMYNSSKSWNIFTNPTNPVPTDSIANPKIVYQLHNPNNSINNVPGPLSAAILKKINNLQLYIAGGNRGRNNPPYYNDEMCVSIINPTNNQIKNVYYENEFKDYSFGAMAIDQISNKIIVIGFKREDPNKATAKLFVINANGELEGTPESLIYNGIPLNNVLQVEIYNHEVFLYSGNTIYRINNYNNSNSTIQAMYSVQGMLGFKAIGIGEKADGYFLTGVYELALNAGFKIVYMPVSTTNNTSPGNDNEITKVEGSINPEASCTPYEFAFADNSIFLSGFTSIYSFKPTVAINNSGKSFQINSKEISIYPNPASTNINVNYNSTNNQQIQLQVYNNQGTLLLTKRVSTIAGNNNIPINVSNFSTGAFVLKVITKTNTSTAQFIKE
jgi:hypothetical protein